MWSSFTNDEKKILTFVLALLAVGFVAAPYVKSRRETRVFSARDADFPSTSTLAITSPVHPPAAGALRKEAGIAPSGQIDLNVATADVLETLPGIGPSRARDIVAFRESNGGFSCVADLDKVKGIGPATMAQLRPLVTVQVTAAVAGGTPLVARATAVSTPVPRSVVNINSADVEELATLDRIGPKMAQRIVEYRSQHGAFQRVEDLLNVTGIGTKTLEHIRHSISLR